MATIGNRLQRGFAWWIHELSSLLPGRGSAIPKLRGPAVLFDGIAGFSAMSSRTFGGPVSPAVRETHLPVLIDVRHVLLREIQLPRMGVHDVRRLVALDADRLMPIDRSAMLISARILSERTTLERIVVELAGLPMGLAEAAVTAARAFRFAPTRFAVCDPADATMMRFDFLDVMRDAGLLPKSTSRAMIWWSVTSIVFCLNVLLVIERDVMARDGLQRLVDGQRAAVFAAQSISTRIERDDWLTDDWRLRSHGNDALGMLALTSIHLPDAAWVQRFSWNRTSLRLVGYQRPAVDAVSALKRVPAFRSARSTTEDVIAVSAAGQPFDVTIVVPQ